MAHRYYPKQSKELRRSKARYKKYKREWRNNKEAAWDLIGGKTGRN